MTRIGNDTKTPASRGTAAGDGARDAKQATQSEDAPTLDELDAGMSLDRSYANPELQRSDVYGSEPQRRATTFADDGGMSSFEGMTPIDETPLARDIAGIEQQFALEMQGHAYELRALGAETAGDDGVCLEQAADALMTSSEAAGQARAGSALPVLEQGVTNASGHVNAVVDDEVRGKGAGLLDKAWSGLARAKEAVSGALRAVRPEPQPGETREIGIAGAVGLGVVGGESKDVLSIGRERNSDGSGGDYVVAREVTLGGFVGPKGKAGVGGELLGQSKSLKADVSLTNKHEGSMRVEYRSASLEKAKERWADLATDKVVIAGVSGAAAAVPGAAVIAGALAEAAVSDLKEASAVTFTGGHALEGSAELGVLKGQAASKDVVELKLALTEGEAKSGQLTITTQVEASGSVSAMLGKGSKVGLDSIPAGSVTMAMTRKTPLETNADGTWKTKPDEIGATVTMNIAGSILKAELVLAPGEDADAIAQHLADGDESAALNRLLSSGGTMTLSGGTRDELAIGGQVALAAELGARGHVASSFERVLEREEGAFTDVLQRTLPKHVRSLAGGSLDLERQMSANQILR